MIASKYRFHGHGSLKFLYKNGQAVRSRYFTVRYITNPRRQQPRFAVVISKKVHKSAVGRNRIRRQVYEHLRVDVLPRVKNVDIAVIVTNGEALSLAPGDLKSSLDAIFAQIIAWFGSCQPKRWYNGIDKYLPRGEYEAFMHDLFQLLIVQPIFNALMLLYSIIPWHDFGLAIIIFTIILRFVMYPLIKSQLNQTKLMRKMQPELAKIKKNAKGDRQAEAMQQMELYKRYGIKPMRSVLVLIIQLPVFIGLYQVIRIIISLKSEVISQYLYEPIKNIDVIQSIIQNPANFNHTMLGFIDLTKTTFSNHGIDFFLLALAAVSAITQYIITKQTAPTAGKNQKRFRDLMKEAAEGKEADPTEMSGIMTRGMMKVMPVMMFLIMVGLPGALALYYTASNLVAAAQQHFLLRKDAEEMHEIAEEASTPKKSKKTKTREKKAKEAHITRIKAK